MSGRTLRQIDEARDSLMRRARYDWLETYCRKDLGAMAAIAEETGRMVRDCLAALDELRET